MRSSKNRSRSKGNRNNNRSVGNVVNRVFDSSGPEGKVRGTPQQIIDKYAQLARDAHLSNDRVAAENFQQHGEHYTRMMGEAQREMDARREQQESQQQGQNANTSGNDGNGNNNNANQGNQPRRERNDDRGDGDRKSDQRSSDGSSDSRNDAMGDVIETGGGSDAGLVETPESGDKPKRPRARRPRKPVAQDSGADDSSSSSGNTPEAAE